MNTFVVVVEFRRSWIRQADRYRELLTEMKLPALLYFYHIVILRIVVSQRRLGHKTVSVGIEPIPTRHCCDVAAGLGEQECRATRAVRRNTADPAVLRRPDPKEKQDEFPIPYSRVRTDEKANLLKIYLWALLRGAYRRNPAQEAVQQLIKRL